MTGIIFGHGGKYDSDSLDLQTRKGTHINNTIRLEANPARLKEAVRINQGEHPNAILRSATQKYDCMGMVFASRRTWIDIGSLDLILREDEYVKLDSIDEAELGDVVIYGTDISLKHVGILIRIEPNIIEGTKEYYILSQWGADCEWIHQIDDVPDLYGKVKEVWSDRKCVT